MADPHQIAIDDQRAAQEAKYPGIILARVRRRLSEAGAASCGASLIKGFAAVASWQTRRHTVISLAIGYPEEQGNSTEYEAWVVEGATSRMHRLLIGWPPSVELTLAEVTQAVESALETGEGWSQLEWTIGEGRRETLLRRRAAEQQDAADEVRAG